MDKDKVAAILREKGFNAVNAAGVVTIYVPSGEGDSFREKARKAIRDINYDKSWGILPSSKSADRIIPLDTPKEDESPIVSEEPTGQISFI